MIDHEGRAIDYMRISITDRCNLRCKYCMPDEVPHIPHHQIMRFDEILRMCKIAIQLGITKFKITGGEPFVRKNAMELIEQMKGLEGVENVTITTNGLNLEQYLEHLQAIAIDGINISLDTVDADTYTYLSGYDKVQLVLNAIEESLERKIPTKLNVVLLDENKDHLLEIVNLARDKELDIRLIELMAIGNGKKFTGPSGNEVYEWLKGAFPDLHEVKEHHGNGPAVYYRTSQLRGSIGFISANSHKFCDSCNRVRITSTGVLKPCLCYEEGVDLLSLLRGQATDEEIREIMEQVIYHKPYEHSLGTSNMTEARMMNAIGG